MYKYQSCGIGDNLLQMNNLISYRGFNTRLLLRDMTFWSVSKQLFSCYSAREMDYIMIAPEKYYPRQSHNGYPVYSDEDNAVIWHCDTKSPCAHPPPAEWGIPEYFFLLEFSNKYVNWITKYCICNVTLCSVMGYSEIFAKKFEI